MKSIENPFDLKVQIRLNQTDEFSFFIMVPHRKDPAQNAAQKGSLLTHPTYVYLQPVVRDAPRGSPASRRPPSRARRAASSRPRTTSRRPTRTWSATSTTSRTTRSSWTRPPLPATGCQRSPVHCFLHDSQQAPTESWVFATVYRFTHASYFSGGPLPRKKK